jgi:hypothetical protein
MNQREIHGFAFIIDITPLLNRLRPPYGKLVAPPFYEVEKGGGKVQTLVSILATAFLYSKEWRYANQPMQAQVQFIYSV